MASRQCERQKLGPVYAEKSCSLYKGHPPTQSTLGQPIARVAGATGEILAALPLSRAKEVTSGAEIPQATQASQPTFCLFLTKRGEMFLLETKSRLG